MAGATRLLSYGPRRSIPPTRWCTGKPLTPAPGQLLCWGAGERQVSAEIWEYLGFPNVTNKTWADYHVQYLNPSADFGSSGADPQRLSDRAETVRAIKQVNPASVVLMTYHTTEVWYKDLVRNNSGQQYLPLDCIMRNADGTPCDWWAPWPNGIITTNMFMPKCLAAVTTYAQRSLPALVAAGLDGVLLDGLVPFSEGCKSRQVDITAAARAATARCGVTVRAHTFIYICQRWFTGCDYLFLDL